MSVFDEKVRSALKKLEAEGKIVIKDDKIFPAGEWAEKKDANTEGLIDPMVFEPDEGSLELKKQAWMDIFQQYPELSNKLIAVFKDKEMDRVQQWINVYLDHHEFGELILGLLDVYGDEVYDNLLVLHNDGKVSLGYYEPPKNENNEINE